MALEAGATPNRISYGNTIKKGAHVARAFELHPPLPLIMLEEVERLRAAPGSRVFCRVLTDGGEGAEWPLSRSVCVPGYGYRRVASCKVARPRPTVCRSTSVRSRRTSPHGIALLAMLHRYSARWLTRRHRLAWSTWAAVSNPLPQGCTDRTGFTAWRSSMRCRSISGNRIPETIIEPGRAWLAMQA